MKFEPSRPASYTPFLRRFTDERAKDLADTAELYRRVKSAHSVSFWAQEGALAEFSADIAEVVAANCTLPDNDAVLAAFSTCQNAILAVEKTIFDAANVEFGTAVLSLKEQVDLRRFLRAQEHFLANQGKVIRLLMETVGGIFAGLADHLSALPHSSGAVTVPLYAFIPNLNAVVDKIIGTIAKDELADAGLFAYLQTTLYENLCGASGIAPYAESKKRLLSAVDSTLPPEKLISTYLRNTPFVELFHAAIPISIPEEARFAGTWIVAPPGRGKTTLLHSLFLEDMHKDAAIILMDSKGELTGPLKQLACIKERLIIIEPDAEYAPALNPFDMGATDVISLLDYIFASLLKAEMTGLQSTLFQYVSRALLEQDNPTLLTFFSAFRKGFPGVTFQDPDLQDFFAGDFDSKTYKDTREQVVWRLRALLANPVFRAMFSAPKTKLHIGEEMDKGKIIVINNSKALLGEAGQEFFSRFFIALILAVAQQRALRPAGQKKPCYVYIDECQTVIKRDEKITTILDECRSQKIALILAHQRCAQIEAPVLDALTNCAVRYANSDDDAGVLAPKLRTTADELRSLPRGTFATHVRDLGSFTLKVSLPTLPASMTAKEQEEVRLSMRQYCTHRDTLQNVAEHTDIHLEKESTDTSKDWN